MLRRLVFPPIGHETRFALLFRPLEVQVTPADVLVERHAEAARGWHPLDVGHDQLARAGIEREVRQLGPLRLTGSTGRPRP